MLTLLRLCLSLGSRCAIVVASRSVLVLVPAAAVLVLFLAACDSSEGEEPSSPSPSTTQDFRGLLGGFEIIGSESGGQVTICAGQATAAPADVLRSSELYTPSLGISIEGGICEDGIVSAVSNYGEPDNKLARGRLLFRGVPKLVWDAPRERLHLLTVRNRSAIAEIPSAGSSAGKARLAVIQRQSSDDLTGILIWVDAHPDDGGLSGATDLAEKLLEEAGQQGGIAPPSLILR